MATTKDIGAPPRVAGRLTYASGVLAGIVFLQLLLVPWSARPVHGRLVNTAEG